MVGRVTVYDNSVDVGNITFRFNTVNHVQHLRDVRYEEADPAGDKEQAVEHNKTVRHQITVDFTLRDMGTYDGPPTNPLGDTGSIWILRAGVVALEDQPSNAAYRIVEEDDTQNTAGWQGIITKILFDQNQPTQGIFTGTIVFLVSTDVNLFSA